MGTKKSAEKRAVKRAVKKRAALRPKLSLIPQSTAQNAYQLLDEVIAAIQAEPARLNMSQWAFTPKQVGRMKAIPACGTVGCVAGWVTFLGDRKVRNKDMRPDDDTADNYLGDIPGRASILLTDSWNGDGLYALFNSSGPDIDNLKPGSPAYVAAVVARIRTFQRTYAERLLRRELPAPEVPRAAAF